MIKIKLHNSLTDECVGNVIMPAVPRDHDIIVCSGGVFSVDTVRPTWYFKDDAWHCVIGVRPEDPEALGVKRAIKYEHPDPAKVADPQRI